MLLNFILIPFINLGLDFAGLELNLDLIDMETMLPVLFGMLGLGSMRTAEKNKRRTEREVDGEDRRLR